MLDPRMICAITYHHDLARLQVHVQLLTYLGFRAVGGLCVCRTPAGQAMYQLMIHTPAQAPQA